MDHDVVVRQKMAERYLLDELDSDSRGEFEEHFFDCPDCAIDIKAGALFIEQSKIALAEKSHSLPVVDPVIVQPGWLAALHSMFRPAFAVPVMALLLGVIGYQNLVTYPQLARKLNSPNVLPWASVNVGTWGSAAPVITALPGEGFLLFVRIPPDNSYSSYMAELYNPTGKLEWSLAIPMSSAQKTSSQDQWPVQVPAANREAGSYKLAVRGVTATGDSKEVGQASFELQLLK